MRTACLLNQHAPVQPMLTSMTAAAALLAGLTGSAHCAVMCGPLAASRRTGALWWHVGRIAAYALVGFTLGALGRSTLLTLRLDVTPVLPWVMAAGLVLTAFDVGKRLPALPGVTHVAKWLAARAQLFDARTRSLLLGAATPFLPCGLLYGLFLAALASASPLMGALLMVAFAAGSTPALAVVQHGFSKLSPSPWLRRGLLLLAAGVLVARALLTPGETEHCG